jgi:hypothetical protein
MGIKAGPLCRFPPVAVAYIQMGISKFGKRDVKESQRQMKEIVGILLTSSSLRLGSVREPVNLALRDRMIVGIGCFARNLTVRI